MVERVRKEELDKTPRIDVYSLGRPDSFVQKEMDYFPELDPRAVDGPDREAILALKDGTYRPYMQTVDYRGQVMQADSPEDGNGKMVMVASIDTKKAGPVIPLHGAGTFRLMPHPYESRSAASRSISGPGSMVISPTLGGLASPGGGITGEAQRIGQLERMYGNKMNRSPIRRKYYANPRQYYDHVLLADAYANTFAGTIAETLVDFVVGKGVYPKMALRKPSGDAEADKKELEEARETLDTLNAIDDWYSDTAYKEQDTWFDIPFQDKIKSAVLLMFVFGRDCIVKERWDHMAMPEDAIDLPSKPEGNRSFLEGEQELPNVLKVIHPIEMGLTEVELYSGKVAGLWISNDQPYVPMSQMMYFVNGHSSPMIGTATYGYSRLQRCIAHTRLYRRLFDVNFPQYLRASATGMGAFVMNTTGYPAAVRNAMRESLRNIYTTGEIAVIDYANTDDFEWKEFKINTDIVALKDLEQSLLGTISTVLGVPHSIVFDSAESRATLIGRIVTFQNTTVEAARANIGRQLVQQWWLPNLRRIQSEEFLKKFTVVAEYRELSLETKLEKVERLLQETQLNPYKDSYLGEELGISDYLSKIDEEKLEEQKQQEQDMIDAKAKGPPSAQSAAGADGGKKDGGSKGPAGRANSKNGSPLSTKRETMKRRGTGSGSS